MFSLFSKAGRWLIPIVLIVLAAAVVVGLFMTAPSKEAALQQRQRRGRLVDEKPVKTARAMAALASTREEQRYAQQALKLADHEVDLAFSFALRDATEHPPKPTPETKELYARIKRAQTSLKDDQALIDELKKSANGKAPSPDLQKQLDLVQAQLELDQDDLQDAQDDLFRSGADPLSRIQLQFARYQAAQQAATTTPMLPALAETMASSNLIDEVRTWRAFRNKRDLLRQAASDAQTAAADLAKQRDNRKAQGDTATTAPNDAEAQQPAQESDDSSQSVINSLKRMSQAQKDLFDLDKRSQDEQELATVYQNWLDFVRTQRCAALHNILRSLLYIILIALAFYLASALVDRLIPDSASEHTRLRTLRLILRVSLQAAGLLLVLLVIFGAPNQTSTILGLATAGLTIALKDFIVAFVGWFVLIGRNGVRVGDWVEINGVVGEVVEITLMRTVLLETGNWTDIGHPTGRKVTFMNGYAIEGHYFNFSTAGQWLWDEISLAVPADRDPYPILDAIQKIVAKETESSARTAEQEWSQASSRYMAQNISAAPAINLRPTGSAVEIHVRYITRANERFVRRARLYQALVDLLHRKESQK